ncbi:helix-turn-helix transcriptional regulator, partial [Winogradskyella sp.]
VKVKGFEQFIEESKKDIKRISNIDDAIIQRAEIKNLYRNLHLHSSTLVGNGTDHLNLINDLNVDFFNELSQMHPELNESEIIICYYLFAGFKNKEIAAFLNTSIRSVESRRYRIGKKLKIKDKELSLVAYLTETFKGFS